MSRRLLFIVVVLGVIAAPFIYSFNATGAEAQDIDLDLIVIEPAPATAKAYLDLVKQKIELLTAEELARETETLRKELAELQAARKLREVEQKLEQLIEQFQGSSAAERARVMLEAGRRQNPPIYNTNETPFENHPGRPMRKPGSRLPQAPTDADFGKPVRSIPNPS